MQTITITPEVIAHLVQLKRPRLASWLEQHPETQVLQETRDKGSFLLTVPGLPDIHPDCDHGSPSGGVVLLGASLAPSQPVGPDDQ